MLRWILAFTAFAAFAQTAPDTSAEGKVLFESHCALCHGIGGKGSRGPSLTRPRLARAPDDAALKKLIESGIEPEMPSSWFLAESDVSNLVQYVRSLGRIAPEPVPGHAARGEKLYEENKCSACHIIAGSGTAFGPELTEIGARRSVSHLRESIAKPNAAVPEGFLLVEVKTKGGQTIRGVRVNEDSFTIQIKDSAGKFHSLRKTDRADLKKLRGQSPMPSYESMPAADLDDLVAYLVSLGVKP